VLIITIVAGACVKHRTNMDPPRNLRSYLAFSTPKWDLFFIYDETHSGRG